MVVWPFPFSGICNFLLLWVFDLGHLAEGQLLSHGLDYCGDSAIIDPLGEVLATGAGGETVLLADLDAAPVASTRSHFRFLQDRR